MIRCRVRVGHYIHDDGVGMRHETHDLETKDKNAVDEPGYVCAQVNRGGVDKGAPQEPLKDFPQRCPNA